ncbi:MULTISPECIES: triose-phosphate isomerase [Thermomonosporaceae]|uniref:triose-phosphate isomerase n=1 Tax=Thermomonosporaceae TaxID=2012 RepID=UPI00255AB31C|nr:MULTISPECIES: triose-phosphate isomerase [Thermomonosporaceae]MDL4777183.1 triose-phosphate isomerase [Actinomadura xylanilytica]
MAQTTPSRKPLMAGNWKMNNNHLEAIALVQKMAFALKEADYDAVDAVVLPPFTAIRSVQTLIDADRLAIGYGAQDVSQHASGAYTGEISAAMLAKLGCSYVTVGHSERRQYHAEDDATVNAKARAALGADITPILCVGEGLEVRKAGGQVAHCLAQIDGGLEKITAAQARRTVIAYEPVWAIGTGEVATPQDAQEVCAAIRTRLAELYDGGVADEVRILYGGSVKGGNIAGIMAQADVDGTLVGGASLDPGEFVKICRYRDLPV